MWNSTVHNYNRSENRSAIFLISHILILKYIYLNLERARQREDSYFYRRSLCLIFFKLKSQVNDTRLTSYHTYILLLYYTNKKAVTTIAVCKTMPSLLYLCRPTKGKCMVLYSTVSSPLDRSKRFTLSSPGRPVHSDTVLGFSWKHSSHAAIAQRLFTHISTTVYSQVLIYTAESTEASWSERKCPNFETVTTGIRTRALSIASPAFYQLSYRAPLKYTTVRKNPSTS